MLNDTRDQIIKALNKTVSSNKIRILIMWIVSDKDDTKWLCETKPTREKNSWSDKGKCIMLGEFPFNNTPSFVNQIEWKDTPLQVKFELKKK